MVVRPAGKQGTDGTEAPEASIMEAEAVEGPGKEDYRPESGVEQSRPGVVIGDDIRTDHQPGGVDSRETSDREERSGESLPRETFKNTAVQ